VHIDLPVTVAGLVVGLLVGLTGMGGGALLTPLLVLVFRVSPLAAISSDLLTSLVMKPVGAAVHARRGTVNWRLVGWLSAGAVPAGFAGAVVIGMIGHGSGVTDPLTMIIGIALCAAVATTVFRQVMDRRAARRAEPVDGAPAVRPLVTVLIGVVGGFAVGLTSVGAGSLIIAMLLVAYPGLRPSHLVGTDIMQAIPLVAAATVGHLIFGDVQLALTASLLLGALPGVYLGARLSAQGPVRLIRPVVTAVLLASALALLDVAPVWIVAGAVAALVVTAWLSRTRRPALPSVDDRTPEPVGRT
jgi:uncharacterized protein